MNLAVLPRDFSTEMTVEVPFMTNVAESVSGVSGRKSARDIPLRTYTLTINPESALEVLKMVLAHRGARWPVAIRDYFFNYQLTDEPQTISGSSSPDVGYSVKLTKTWTPATGSRTFAQRILILDQATVPFTVKRNGTPVAPSPGFSITDPGILTIPGMAPGDTVTVSGEYLVPCVFVDDALTGTVHIDNLASIDALHLREIPEAELIALTA